MLNEISQRFNSTKRPDEQGIVMSAFAKPSSRLDNHNDDEKIKFISMMDSKPIKPSYLDLIPMKNFAKKE